MRDIDQIIAEGDTPPFDGPSYAWSFKDPQTLILYNPQAEQGWIYVSN